MVKIWLKVITKKTIYMNNLPSETWHGFKYIDFGPDGNLYIPVEFLVIYVLNPRPKIKDFKLHINMLKVN